MMPAFSEATLANVSPKKAVCSSEIVVIIASSGDTTLVASKRPPSPVSISAISIP
ncbi:hypothetical protein OL548_28895 [Lysinibacillus sp. MHQ-1]|nr:hypothetical protein OL548_28895 [Lysinibacillus sp. MHQ-1]